MDIDGSVPKISSLIPRLLHRKKKIDWSQCSPKVSTLLLPSSSAKCWRLRCRKGNKKVMKQALSENRAAFGKVTHVSQTNYVWWRMMEANEAWHFNGSLTKCVQFSNFNNRWVTTAKACLSPSRNCNKILFSRLLFTAHKSTLNDVLNNNNNTSSGSNAAGDDWSQRRNLGDA